MIIKNLITVSNIINFTLLLSFFFLINNFLIKTNIKIKFFLFLIKFLIVWFIGLYYNLNGIIILLGGFFFALLYLDEYFHLYCFSVTYFLLFFNGWN